MLTSIQLDDEFSAGGAKIHDVIADGMLLSKVDMLHAVGSQVCPKFFFDGCEVLAQFSGIFADFGCGSVRHFAPSVLAFGGTPPPIVEEQGRQLGEDIILR